MGVVSFSARFGQSVYDLEEFVERDCLGHLVSRGELLRQLEDFAFLSWVRREERLCMLVSQALDYNLYLLGFLRIS
jgi:hypothetical protein